jgi:hypothetical protein
MRTRVQVSVFILSAVVGSALTAALAQDAATSADAYKVPLTPWGDPDLQGTWDYKNITPLQRPDNVGDREFFTDDEIAKLEGRAAERLDTPPDEDTPANLVHAQYMTDPGRLVDDAHRTSLIVDPPNGHIPDLTAEAQARRDAGGGRRGGFGQKADSYTDRSLMERCITQGFPRAIMPTLYNNNIEIVQGPGYAAIVHEMIHETRVVPLDGSDFTGLRAYMGESRGHWEGNTLVVETRNFNDEVSFQGAGENLRVTERYTRVAPDRIAFSMTLEDDTEWTQPWTVAYSMRPTDGSLFEYACHEGNYGLRNILQNARDAERAEAAASGG